ncbi:DUF924 family protein [Vibrio lentus]|nr:DUF924 family protein [Vibrio lentus]
MIIERFGRYPHRNEVLGESLLPKKLSSCSNWVQAFNCRISVQ